MVHTLSAYSFCVCVTVLVSRYGHSVTIFHQPCHTQIHSWIHKWTCTSPFAKKVVHFKALISLAGGASLHLHLVIIEGTSALCELAPVYIAITHNASTLTQTDAHTQRCTNTVTEMKASTYACTSTHTCQHLHTHTVHALANKHTHTHQGES